MKPRAPWLLLAAPFVMALLLLVLARCGEERGPALSGATVDRGTDSGPSTQGHTGNHPGRFTGIAPAQLTAPTLTAIAHYIDDSTALVEVTLTAERSSLFGAAPETPEGPEFIGVQLLRSLGAEWSAS